jgi:hypothetical protein
LKNEEWKFTCGIHDNSSITEVTNDIMTVYGLDEAVAEELVFTYYSYHTNEKGDVKKTSKADHVR